MPYAEQPVDGLGSASLRPGHTHAQELRRAGDAELGALRRARARAEAQHTRPTRRDRRLLSAKPCGLWRHVAYDDGRMQPRLRARPAGLVEEQRVVTPADEAVAQRDHRVQPHSPVLPERRARPRTCGHVLVELELRNVRVLKATHAALHTRAVHGPREPAHRQIGEPHRALGAWRRARRRRRAREAHVDSARTEAVVDAVVARNRVAAHVEHARGAEWLQRRVRAHELGVLLARAVVVLLAHPLALDHASALPVHAI
mmetsp:Transcript_11575/g.30131  ORF Transcript_11575/g.30131 Transcript_11575/m.30131 type:complete len:258 (-) Transcript_11575:875-1648(-)